MNLSDIRSVLSDMAQEQKREIEHIKEEMEEMQRWSRGPDLTAQWQMGRIEYHERRFLALCEAIDALQPSPSHVLGVFK